MSSGPIAPWQQTAKNPPPPPVAQDRVTSPPLGEPARWATAGQVLTTSSSLGRFLVELARERERQEAKFPEQHLPSSAPATAEATLGYPPVRALTSDVRAYVEVAAAAGMLSWRDVLHEEFCEAIDEADAGDVNVDALRSELVQVAAVCARWIEDLDRAGVPL